ncbi:MAG: hypothetical protein J07HB67_02827, partial [halophilic archaeon J07HB67]
TVVGSGKCLLLCNGPVAGRWGERSRLGSELHRQKQLASVRTRSVNRRRLAAVFELFVSLVGAVGMAWTYRESRRRGRETTLDWRRVVGGVAWSVVYHQVDDHDLAGVQTSRVRGLIWGVLSSRVLDAVSGSEIGVDTALGVFVGTVSHRLWYGLLEPLPTE